MESQDMRENLKLKGRGGWVLEAIPTGNGEHDFIITNPTAEGLLKFFSVTTVGNPYGAPMIEQEPSLRIPMRDAGIDMDGDIVGAVICDANGHVVERASLSNLFFMKGQSVEINLGGEVLIDGESKGFIQMLVNPDKNRLVGYVALVGPNPPNNDITVHELETLAVALLTAR